MMIERRQESQLLRALGRSPAVVLLGPRQVGKTTLARLIADRTPGSLYLDLERPADARRLDDADEFLRSHLGRLVVLDEVHRAPHLFETLRGVIDEGRRQGHRHGQFLLLGSASPHLMGVASESLAGRLAAIDLAPIDPIEARRSAVPLNQTWLHGGFPDSLLASDADSFDWREDFVRTYLEREVPMFAPRVPGSTLGRLWQMLAHQSGGMLNASTLAAGLGVSSPTVTRYVDLLEDLGLIRSLRPWHANLGKRLVKRPRVLVRDTGILHALVGVRTFDDLLGHPVVGPSFETLAIETALAIAMPYFTPYFFRTANGAEIDLLLCRGGKPHIAIEVKRSTAPVPSPGFYQSADDLGVQRALVVYPGEETYPLMNGVIATPLLGLEGALAE
jgi:predicted AAA+ superfamily ATPase